MSIFNPFNKFNCLIVVTGLPGAGKTTLTYNMSKVFDIACLSLDEYKESESIKHGFNNKFERDIVFTLAKQSFKIDILNNVRLGLSLIIESAFSKEWQDFFDYIVEVYNYDLIVVDCTSRNFDDIWDSRVKRDLSDDRLQSLISEKFKDGKCIKRDTFLLSDAHKSLSKTQYDNGWFNSIQGDYHITDEIVYKEFLNVDIT